ncbi:NAD(P)/FAD-dependent oxidoreductase [Georgenia muralis]|uniref:NAD/ferredoxin-dependent reductase-like protein n=1 Tax=Georgenia muralis TaxID=154117 RepID=A0A3N4Z2X2_9MICO|nr:FAD-dependent oxidoreductase [Georgenia muralis]RPF25986.1 NAD/ferredoxin-dependent reductase-like protein [Georgenia muralis]
MDTIAIIGAGLTAASAAGALREDGFDGRVVVVGTEPHLPYQRPPLSKGYLLGAVRLDEAAVHPAPWYAEHHVDLRLGVTATAIDLDRRTVVTDRGTLRYDRLLIATGARPRRLPLVDDSGAPATTLRTIEDSRRIKAELRPGRRIVVVGGGWIGLEVAAAARAAGAQVTVLEAGPLPLVRPLGPEVAELFRALHVEHGVDLRTGVVVTSVRHDGGEAVVTLLDGTTLRADLLVVGIGAVPDVGLAEAAGLRTDDGVVVDEHLRTSHRDVYAAGDVAQAYHPLLGRHVRVEHWDNALRQGRAAARSMLGASEPYARLPYFFTDQYDVGIEYVGSVGPDGYDELVLRGDVRDRRFSAFWVKEGRVLAGMHANERGAMRWIRTIVTVGQVDLSGLRDRRVELSTLAA